ncbi:MAG: hypothetical protein ABL997_18940, partial [Planctomycetota bacterium]
APGSAQEERFARAVVLAFEAEDHGQCVRLFEVASELRRIDDAARVAYLRSLVATGQSARFVAAARSFASAHPMVVESVFAVDEERLLPLADASLRSGQTEEGLWVFSAMAEQLPLAASRLANLALAQRHVGDLHGARRSYERALALAPEDPSTWNDFGLLLRVSGELAAARSAFQRSWNLDAKAGEGPSITNLVIDAVLTTDAPDPMAQAKQALATRPDAALLRRAVIDLVLQRAASSPPQQDPDNRARGR